MGNLVLDCTGGTAGDYEKRIGFVADATLWGASFHGRVVESAGGYRRVDGQFVSDRKATGTLQVVGIPGAYGDTCNSAAVPFTATR
jgi:hypothetical protein